MTHESFSKKLSDLMMELYEQSSINTIAGRERSLVMTKLEEAQLWWGRVTALENGERGAFMLPRKKEPNAGL